MTAEFVFKQDGQGNELIVLLACLTVQNAAHEKMMHTVQLLACHLQCPVTWSYMSALCNVLFGQKQGLPIADESQEVYFNFD